MADLSKYMEKYGDIISYLTDYHTADLLDLLLEKREDKKEAAKVAAAVALRNGLHTLDPHTLYHSVRHHTSYLIDKTEMRMQDSDLSDAEKKHKIACYCAAIAVRNGLHDDWPILVEIAKIVIKVI